MLNILMLFMKKYKNPSLSLENLDFKKYYLLMIPAISLVLLGFLIVSAQNEDPFANLTYPIAELGNCENKSDCAAYCDNSDNMSACVAFAEQNSLLPEEDINLAKKMLAAGETAGPGGCKGQAECKSYCDDINNIEECITFAEAHDLLPPEELAEGKKVLQAIKQGLTPPGCQSKTECDSFCRQPENMESCITFGEAAGLIPPEELKEAKMALEAVKKGVKPPPCGGREECDTYCSAPENMEECITFAEAAGFMSADEAAMVRKTGGKGPGDCRGKDQCEAYCEDPANGEECINFAIEMGMMAPEEAEQAKKMLAAGFRGGPGGCRGKEECENYCNDFSHQQECMDFAVANGFMSADEAEQAKQMMRSGFSAGPGGCQGKDECEAFCQDPSHTEECIQFAQQTGMMSPEEAQMAEQGRMMMRQGGPGGCQGAEDCKAYCEDLSRLEECANFASQQGLISQEEMEKMREQMQQQQGMPPGFVPSQEERPGEEQFGPGIMPPEGFAPPEGMMPQEGFTQPPTPEQMRQIQQQYQEQYKQESEQQYQQQYQEQYQQEQREFEQQSPQPSPEPVMEPQSLFKTVKNFLATIISIFKIK